MTANDSTDTSTGGWLVKLRSPTEIYELHPDFLKNELLYYTLALLTFIHAFRKGGRYRWLWIGIVLHGLAVEYVSYMLPDVDNFWHAQGMVMFIGQRLPLYVVVIYVVFIYTASVAVAHMRLKWWAYPFAVGISVVLLDIPYDIMGIKCLFWTWHDTDPNIYDRHYWVPWTSYYFHATFACGFTTAFHLSHKLIAWDKHMFQNAGFFKELVCTLIASMLGFPLGVLQFVPIYHPLHDTFSIHTEVCVMIQMAIYVLIVWYGDDSVDSPHKQKKKFQLDEILTLVIAHYMFWIYLVFTAKPETIKAVGLHEPIGPCQETVPVYTPFGHVLAKQKYLCLDKYDEPYYDFHCVEELPAPGSEWYTICGTAFPNHIEYICVVTGFALFGFLYYFNLLTQLGPLPHYRHIHIKPKQS